MTQSELIKDVMDNVAIRSVSAPRRGWYISSRVSEVYLYKDGMIRPKPELANFQEEAFWDTFDEALVFFREWKRKTQFLSWKDYVADSHEFSDKSSDNDISGSW